MNDLEFRKKKTGMTLGKAGLLFVFCFILVILLAIGFGIYSAANGGKPGQADIKNIMIAMSVCYLVAAIIGFKINNYEFPFNYSFNFKTFLFVIILAFSHYYFSTIMRQLLFVFDETKQRQFELMKDNFLILLFSSFSSFILLLPVACHGLLRNYSFGKTMVGISLFSLFNMDPQAIVLSIFLSIYLILIYQKTASIWLSFIFYLLTNFFEFWSIYVLDAKNYFNNLLRFEIIKNDNLYFTCLVISAIALIALTFYFYKEKTPIVWQKQDEYESFDFT